MLSAAPTPLPGLAHTFALILTGLRGAAAARLGRDPVWGPVMFRVLNRLSRLAGRFALLVARAEAGQAAPRRPPATPTKASEAPPRKPRERWPEGFGWLARLGGFEVRGHGSQLQHLLGQPEMAALLAAAPQAVRILRPLCKMLGISAEAVPILGPPRPRAPRPRSRPRPQRPKRPAKTPVPIAPATHPPVVARYYPPPPPTAPRPLGAPPEGELGSFAPLPGFKYW